MNPNNIRLRAMYLVALGATLALSSHTLLAQPAIPTFSFHENGNGQLELPLAFGGGVIPLPGALTSDPGPGGLMSALAFTAHPQGLPFPVGDVVLLDASGDDSDILRFNPATVSPDGLVTQLIFFYSNDQGGLLADTGLPLLMYGNTVHIFESQSGPTIYTPHTGQPGFSSDSSLGDTFQIFSTPDSGSTLLLFGVGGAFLALVRRKILALNRPFQQLLAGPGQIGPNK